MKIEYRTFPVELRTADGEAPRLVGHAAIYNSLSEDLGGFREQIAPGAFAKTLSDKADVRALFNHDPNFVLGRTSSGTLRLSEDERGLAMDVTLPQTPLVRDMVLEPIRRGDIDQMSFGFQVVKGGDSWDESGEVSVRTLREVKLFDVSPVTFPAYAATDVSARSIAPAEVLREHRAAVPPPPEPAAAPTTNAAPPPDILMKIAHLDLLIDQADAIVDEIMVSFNIPDPPAPGETPDAPSPKRSATPYSRRYTELRRQRLDMTR